jgi:hypothetical protein
MPCPEYLRLKKEEISAWTAYNYAKYTNTLDDDELRRRRDRATLSSTKVDQHMQDCRRCKTARSA